MCETVSGLRGPLSLAREAWLEPCSLSCERPESQVLQRLAAVDSIDFKSILQFVCSFGQFIVRLLHGPALRTVPALDSPPPQTHAQHVTVGPDPATVRPQIQLTLYPR